MYIYEILRDYFKRKFKNFGYISVLQQYFLSKHKQLLGIYFYFILGDEKQFNHKENLSFENANKMIHKFQQKRLKQV